MRQLLLILSLFSAVATLTACTYEYDAGGKLYPPDSACDAVASCVQGATASLGTCLDGVTAGDDYASGVWACVGASACLNSETTSAQFEGFLGACFNDPSLGHPFDALFLNGAMDTLDACLVGAKADQGLLIDVCATE